MIRMPYLNGNLGSIVSNLVCFFGVGAPFKLRVRFKSTWRSWLPFLILEDRKLSHVRAT